MGMARFRRGLQPVNRIKHIVDNQGGLSGGIVSVIPIVVTVNQDSPVFNPAEVKLASTVNAFFVSVFVIGATGAPLNGAIDWYIYKRRGGQSNADFPDPGNTGTSNVRNQIIHEEKGLAGSGDGTAMAFKGVIVIPRGMRRMREGDEWFMKLKSTDATSDAQFCTKYIFNSFK